MSRILLPRSGGVYITLRYVFQENTNKVDASNNFSVKMRRILFACSGGVYIALR
jgi:hypothetical protein